MEIELDGSSDLLDDLMTSPNPKRARVVRVADLAGFDTVDGNILVRKSEKDLWRLNGDGVIERLFEDADPLEG